MGVSELDLRELLEIYPGGGDLKVGGTRVLLFDALAMGLLRKQLIETLSIEGARTLLAQFGYAHGWHAAKRFKESFPWTSREDWRLAGARLHALYGLVKVSAEPFTVDPPEPFAQSVWESSYEAEQHRLHLGIADHPVCWTLTGFASGYLSYVNERRIYCLEHTCVGAGDDRCRLVGRALSDWPREAQARCIELYESNALGRSLRAAAQSLNTLTAYVSKERHQATAQASIAGVEEGLVARSAAMQRALEVGLRVAQVDSTVLIRGESGVGKERLARVIHNQSPRKAGPFVAVNCGAVEETLLSSELFGHAKGAFTGATQSRLGIFEAAHGGTLLLDEIGEISQSMQVKLLRVLQEREIRRVGETVARPVDVRIVAATHRDLEGEVKRGRFREDLFYRLRVIKIVVPPLRERADDVLALAHTFLKRITSRLGREVRGFTPDAVQLLLAYGWPGNVRELENAVEHAVVLTQGAVVSASDLPAPVANGSPQVAASSEETTPKPTRLADVERAHVMATLERLGGNRLQTARALGISEATIHRKLNRWKRSTSP